MEVGEYVDRILKIIVWGTIGFIAVILVLKWLGISSPERILETLA